MMARDRMIDSQDPPEEWLTDCDLNDIEFLRSYIQEVNEEIERSQEDLITLEKWKAQVQSHIASLTTGEA